MPALDSGWATAEAWQCDAHHVLSENQSPAPGASLAGICDACGLADGFQPVQHPADIREGLHCKACGCMARQRAVARVLNEILDGVPSPDIYLTEQASPLYVALRRRFPATVGTEYISRRWRRLRLMSWLWRHGVFQRIRHGDVTRLGDADASLDAVASLDVLEHVPDATAAFRELARVLRPGGCLVATVPFYQDAQVSTRVASLDAAGNVVFHGAPEYHGDPLGGGVVCFHHFGWDLPETLTGAGFSSARLRYVRDPERGLPHGIWVIVARR
ncbi:class I SAM-dependent methyltransferase [Luteimonas sp BLCC-B24]|uniref:class I SAM-dependent methyltransferase n=1 Tax=Luteimonas sp. BLCC-B24 TaxID=3025317 RepID=UPI00234E3516|nr:class I SAM-dependent methyltransferase [Luteimonas sp. BLCC-B24]MDC7806198.1 class I SAM-dependent methyltransferase [Luteimonas sp. BLCC-B24]